MKKDKNCYFKHFILNDYFNFILYYKQNNSK